MKSLLLVFLSLFPITLFGQSTIRGIVVDSLTQEPLSMATVYVNGTTQGTTTDSDGRFELKDVSFPATVVFSYVGYQPEAMDLTRNPGRLIVGLKPNVDLPEVVVSGKSNKVSKEDLDYFKRMFLGDDRWGKRATIMNEEVLMVDHSYKTSYQIRQISSTSFATPYASNDIVVKHKKALDTVKVVSNIFTAWASEPLMIDMPLLGYEVYVDLVRFIVVKTNNIVSYNMLGYFYYRPYEILNKRKAKNIEENRKRAYYGSSQHFLRSFAQNRLAENGFMLTMPETIVKGKKNITVQLPVDVDKYSTSLSDNLIQINDLKDKKLRIRYYFCGDGSPYSFGDMTKGIHRYSESGLTFLEDKCIFLKKGIVIDNNILFSGDISKKGVGSCLPDDYLPLADTSKIYVKDTVDYASELMAFVDNIQQFNAMFPQEKVYLEFDNTAYFQGENIWFKAFVTNATTLERAPSGVLYVDFLAPTGKLLRQQKLKIVDGQADGAIALLDAGTQQAREKRGIMAYPSGFYEIRAYTQNMLDFSPEAIFSRVIPVYTQPKFVGEYDRSHVITDYDNPLEENLRDASQQKQESKRYVYNDIIKDVNVTFYPEGGQLVRDLPCRVAFKVTGLDGFGREGEFRTSGSLDPVRTVHDGMGSFIIYPRDYEGVQFTAPDSQKVNLRLPDTQWSGYSMISDMLSDSRLQVNIWRTEDRIGEQTALAVTCRGEVIHFEEIKDIENSQLEIDCSDWPVGVCRITLYNKEGMILSSRSIFHNSEKYHSPTITTNLDSLSNIQFGKEVVKFTLTDQEGNPLRDRFCLSVRDAADYGGGRTDNLQTNLLLSSDLRGYIHDPAWYLESNDDEHREALNLLTLVQGWERYEWQTMTGLKDFEEKHRIEEGLTMNGWILSYKKRSPVSDINIYSALTPDDDKSLFESFDYQTDSTGYFGFDLSDFYGNGKFTIHLMSTKKDGDIKYDKSKRIRFERADRPAPRPFYKQETDLDHNASFAYDYEVDFTNDGLTPEQRRKLGRMIDDVDIEEDGGKIRFVDYDTFTSFEAEEDAELELDMGEYTTDLEGYFLERGIRFLGRESEDDFIDRVKRGNYDDNVGSGGSLKNEKTEIGPENESGTEGGNDGKNESGDSKVSEINPYFYVHNSTKYLGLYPYTIDMIDVKSIIFYDKPMYPRDFVDLIPLEVKYHREHMDNFFWWVDTSWDRYYLIDVQIKDDRELLFDWEIRNLGRRVTKVKGFNKPVQFYSPEYPEGPIESNVDARRTLYWNPNVITDEDGCARVEFYNNSFTRKFTISAAGITASGIPYIFNQNW